jgi:hypothetical protein
MFSLRLRFHLRKPDNERQRKESRFRFPLALEACLKVDKILLNRAKRVPLVEQIPEEFTFLGSGHIRPKFPGEAIPMLLHLGHLLLTLKPCPLPQFLRRAANSPGHRWGKPAEQTHPTSSEAVGAMKQTDFGLRQQAQFAGLKQPGSFIQHRAFLCLIQDLERVLNLLQAKLAKVASCALTGGKTHQGRMLRLPMTTETETKSISLLDSFQASVVGNGWG